MNAQEWPMQATRPSFPTLVRNPIRLDDPEPFFQKIVVGAFDVSIQGGHYNYSTPREWLRNADDYDAFEVAIWPTNDPAHWTQVRDYPQLARFARWFEEGKCPVGAWVPREAIGELLAELETVTP